MTAIWLNYHKKQTTCPAPWAKGVQQYVDGCRNAVDEAFKYPKAKEMGDTTVTSLGKYIKKLMSFTNYNSTLVTSSVTSILTSLSTCQDLRESGLRIMIEFDKVWLPLINNFNEVATSLSPHIGDLTCVFTNDVSDFGKEFSNFQKAFIRRSRMIYKCRKDVDYTPVLKKLQKLFNTLGLINDTLLNKCESATEEVHESVMILDLIYAYLSIAVTGINSCWLDEQYKNECHVADSLKSVSFSFETSLVLVVEAVCAITLPLEKSIKKLLSLFVNIVLALNTSVKVILGAVEGVAVTVGEIAQNLLQGLQLSPSVKKDRTNILRAVTRS